MFPRDISTLTGINNQWFELFFELNTQSLVSTRKAITERVDVA